MRGTFKWLVARKNAAVPLRHEQAEVDAWCESTVREQLGAGFASERLHGREVEERGARRLLQLQQALGAQEELRQVRLDAAHRFANAGGRKRRVQVALLRLDGGRVVDLQETQGSSVGSTGSLRLGKTKGGSPLRSSRASGLCSWGMRLASSNAITSSSSTWWESA